MNKTDPINEKEKFQQLVSQFYDDIAAIDNCKTKLTIIKILQYLSVSGQSWFITCHPEVINTLKANLALFSVIAKVKNKGTFRHPFYEEFMLHEDGNKNEYLAVITFDKKFVSYLSDLPEDSIGHLKDVYRTLASEEKLELFESWKDDSRLFEHDDT